MIIFIFTRMERFMPMLMLILMLMLVSSHQERDYGKHIDYIIYKCCQSKKKIMNLLFLNKYMYT